MCTKFYQNRLGFVEGMTKTCRCFFWFTVYMYCHLIMASCLYQQLTHSPAKPSTPS